MKKFLFITLVALTGCGAVHQAQLNNASQNAHAEISEKCYPFLYLPENEAVAWASTNESMDYCSGGHEPWNYNEVSAKSSCGEEIMRQKIRPYVSSKEKFDNLLAQRRDEHIQYAEGLISWDEMSTLSSKRVQDYFESSKGGSYYNYAKCHNSILSDKVMPIYADQLRPSLIKFMADLSAFSRDADKKGMEPEDYQIGYQNLWAQYAANEQTLINQANAQNAQEWQDYSKRMQDYSVELNKQSSTSTISNNQPCMYNIKANAYATCFHVTAGGQCAHFGGVCQP